jgi:flagellin
VTATVNATELSGISDNTTTGTAGAIGAVYVNGYTFSMTLTGDAAKDRASAVTNFNALTGQTGVKAEDTGSALKLTAADGRNISLTIDSNAAYNTALTADGGLGLAAGFHGSDIGLDAATATDGIVEVDVNARLNGIAGAAPTVTALNATTDAYKALAADYAETTTSKVSLHSAGQFTIAAGTNGSVELNRMGFQVGTYGGSQNGQFLKDIDLSTAEGANEALQAIDNALSTVSSERGNLGAVQNRFTSTISSLQTTSENLTAARSRIQDADFAAESAELSRAQILQQAGTAMLAQANTASQGVLSLLR